MRAHAHPQPTLPHKQAVLPGRLLTRNVIRARQSSPTEPLLYHGTMPSAEQWIVLARILRPQGRKGEVLADLFTDFPDRFDQRPRVWLAPQGFAESAFEPAALTPSSATPRSAEVAAHWLPTGRNAGRIVLHFAGVTTIEQAELLAGDEVIIPLEERLPLEEGAAYISDLIGSTVYDSGIPLGIVESVEFATTPDGTRRLDDAAPLLAVRAPNGEELLIPFAQAFLLDLDLPGRAIRMSLPEGLATINAPQTQIDPSRER
jgi:16S rRNA processing protein RimM